MPDVEIKPQRYRDERPHEFFDKCAGVSRTTRRSSAPTRSSSAAAVGILGSHQVRNWKRLQFPRVTVSYAHRHAIA